MLNVITLLLLLQPLMLGQSDPLAVHWLSLSKHARIQRIAMVPLYLSSLPLKVFSDGADTTSLSRLFHMVTTRKEKNVNVACK